MRVFLSLRKNFRVIANTFLPVSELCVSCDEALISVSLEEHFTPHSVGLLMGRKTRGMFPTQRFLLLVGKEYLFCSSKCT